MTSTPIQVIAIVEALSITGPAKNLIEFAVQARQLAAPYRPIQFTFVTQRRPHHPAQDDFLDALASHSLPCKLVREKNALDLAANLSAMPRLIDSCRPDVLQSHSVKSHFWVRLSGLPKRYPWLAFHHGYTTPTRQQRVYNFCDRWSLRSARQVITVTEAFLEELNASGVPRNRVRVVPNAVRTGWIAALDRAAAGTLRAGIADGPTRLIVAVGRLSKEKAHADLIEALSLYSQSAMPIKLVLVGDGPEREALIQLAAARNVPIHMAGQVSDVRPYYAMADLLVLPSLSEGSPNVLLEAMAAGLPIIATRVGGIPETVAHDEHALLVPPGQPRELAAAITQLMTRPERAAQLSWAALQRVNEHYSPQARARLLAGIYQSLLDPAPKSGS